MTKPHGREAVLIAFDRLFDKAVDKLHLDCTDNDKNTARRDFEQRFEAALRIADKADFPSIPEPVLSEMESALRELSPAELAGYIAAGPLAMKFEEILHSVALHAAHQRMLEQALEQADNRYGGN